MAIILLTYLVTVPLRAGVLALTKAGAMRLILANYTAQPQPVLLVASFQKSRCRFLHNSSEHEAAFEPVAFREYQGNLITSGDNGFALTLPPSAVATLDIL